MAFSAVVEVVNRSEQALAPRAGDEVGGYVFDSTLISVARNKRYQHIYQHGQYELGPVSRGRPSPIRPASANFESRPRPH
jgi:hypothetical protein